MPDTIDVRYLISIHALVKRATKSASIALQTVSISIHALVKRATLRHYYMDEIAFISIHALVKRATGLGTITHIDYIFQSTPS